MALTFRQVHEMQSRLARFAIAMPGLRDTKVTPFRHPLPKLPGSLWRPLFLSERRRHSVSGALGYRTFTYNERLSSSMLMGVGVIQSAPRIGYGP
jgi:hypothetical protein